MDQTLKGPPESGGAVGGGGGGGGGGSASKSEKGAAQKSSKPSTKKGVDAGTGVVGDVAGVRGMLICPIYVLYMSQICPLCVPYRVTWLG